jgi:hypothetical protein
VQQGAVLVDGHDCSPDPPGNHAPPHRHGHAGDHLVLGLAQGEHQVRPASRRPTAQVIAAAKAADLHEFITSLPEGYETKIGEDGIKLIRRPEAAHEHRARSGSPTRVFSSSTTRPARSTRTPRPTFRLRSPT